MLLTSNIRIIVDGEELTGVKDILVHADMSKPFTIASLTVSGGEDSLVVEMAVFITGIDLRKTPDGKVITEFYCMPIPTTLALMMGDRSQVQRELPQVEGLDLARALRKLLKSEKRKGRDLPALDALG